MEENKKVWEKAANGEITKKQYLDAVLKEEHEAFKTADTVASECWKGFGGKGEAPKGLRVDPPDWVESLPPDVIDGYKDHYGAAYDNAQKIRFERDSGGEAVPF